MKKKKEQKSKGLIIAVAVAGVVDVLLVVLLVLSFLVKSGGGEELKANLREDFVENAQEYGQTQMTGEYKAQETVEYTSGVTAAQETTSEEDAEPAETETDTADSIYEGFVFPDSDKVELTDSMIQETVTSDSLCRRAINEIYARHGYAFTKQENMDFFNQYDWYKNMTKESDMSKVASQFSSIEKKNVEKLQAFEDSKGWS